MQQGERGSDGTETPAERANRRVCALFDACRAADSSRGVRDAALISVLYGANVGRERTLRLARPAYDRRTGRLDPGRTVPDGRGGRSSRGGAEPANGGRGPADRCWATDGARRALDEWVGLRGDTAGPLFCALEAGAPAPCRPLRARSVGEILGRWARAAGVGEVRPRAFRELYESPWWRGSCPGGDRDPAE